MPRADATSDSSWDRWCTPYGLYSDNAVTLDEITVGFHVVDEEAERDEDANLVQGLEG